MASGKDKGAYEWIIEFDKKPKDIDKFGKILDEELCKINSYYYDERYDTKILGEPKVNIVAKGTFLKWLNLKKKGIGQTKVPTVRNDRSVLDEVLKLC